MGDGQWAMGEEASSKQRAASRQNQERRRTWSLGSKTARVTEKEGLAFALSPDAAGKPGPGPFWATFGPAKVASWFWISMSVIR
jgi:hypothetical protein